MRVAVIVHVIMVVMIVAMVVMVMGMMRGACAGCGRSRRSSARPFTHSSRRPMRTISE